MPMTGITTLGDTSDNSELEEAIRTLRFVVRMNPKALGAVTATASALRAQLPKAALSAEALSIAKQMGRDPEEIAIYRASLSAESADAVAFEAISRDRKLLCRTFGGTDPVARARALGWLGNTPASPGGGRTALGAPGVTSMADLNRKNGDGSGTATITVPIYGS